MSARTVLLSYQPTTMSTAQLAAVSYLARYAGHTHHLYAYQPCPRRPWSHLSRDLRRAARLGSHHGREMRQSEDAAPSRRRADHPGGNAVQARKLTSTLKLVLSLVAVVG